MHREAMEDKDEGFDDDGAMHRLAGLMEWLVGYCEFLGDWWSGGMDMDESYIMKPCSIIIKARKLNLTNCSTD